MRDPSQLCLWAICGLLAVLIGTAQTSAADRVTQVELMRTPNAGIQPQAVVEADGRVHLIYFQGKPAAGNVFYVRQEPNQKNFSTPIPVNSEPDSAIARGTIRGAQLALGKSSRVHVAWNGSEKAVPKGSQGEQPMLYSRLHSDRGAFEPQRNLIQNAFGLDGGGTLAADSMGNVYVAWHAGAADEASRKVWVVRSQDDGATFTPEAAATMQPTGACGCCGMRAYADSRGMLYILYRSAFQRTNRDMHLLISDDQAASFTGVQLDKWPVAVCPMSSATIAETAAGVVTAWETDGQVFLASIDRRSGRPGPKQAASGIANGRKHPTVATNQQGEIILAWIEGSGWERAGTLHWQLFDVRGKPTKTKGRGNDTPVWGLPTAFSRPNGDFVVVY